MADDLVTCGLWRWLQGSGLERFELARKTDTWILRGTIVTQTSAGSAEARYEIACDPEFRTRNVHVAVRDGRGERLLNIQAENGVWYEDGRQQTSVGGAIDVDLGWSPSTNMLPIGRLKLAVGESSGEFVAAWVRFPELTLEPLAQDYLRIADRRYRYSSRGGAFAAELTVDDHGLVIDYEGFWQRVDDKH